MSRIGKKLIDVPEGVNVTISEKEILTTGPRVNYLVKIFLEQVLLFKIIRFALSPMTIPRKVLSFGAYKERYLIIILLVFQRVIQRLWKLMALVIRLK